MTDDITEEGRRFGSIPPDAMTPDQREVMTVILSGPRGSATGLRGPFDALLRRPGLADAVQRVGEYVRFHSSLPTALNEMAIIMTARRWTAEYEWYAHRQMALDAGLDPAVAEAIARGERPDLDADGTAVYDFAEELLRRGQVSDDAWAAVVERWGKEGAIELIGAVGYYCLISFILNVDRYPVPGGILPLQPR